MGTHSTALSRAMGAAIVSLGLCSAAASLPVRAADPATLALKGGDGLAACASCHGQDGAGQASFPRLAGLDAGYLQRQLDSFANGTRVNPVMQPVANALSAADRAAMAVYYAALPVPASLVNRPATPNTDRSAGARLVREGAWQKGVPACEQCHARDGGGVGAAFPPITGQPAGYLSAQLNAWKSGTRKNDPLQLMQSVTRQLTAEEIAAVSEWLAKQPARGGGGR